MAISRKPRLWFPGATYHIMGRGNHRGDIFREDEDYLLFLHLLRDTQKIYPFVLHSYCLMTNHFHLQLETKEKEIWHIMRRFSKLYSANFNDKYRLVGHLFQGRYMSVLIEDDAYFLQTSRYIHRNPVKANMVAQPGVIHGAAIAYTLAIKKVTS